MIDALVSYYDQLIEDQPDKVAPIGWSTTRVSYIATLDMGGELKAIVPLVDRGSMARMVPAQVKRAVNIAANFLCDNCSYLLGVDAKGKPDRTAKCFDAARALHHEVLDGVESPCARAIRGYFEQWKPSAEHPVLVTAGDKLLAGGNIAFMVEIEGRWVDPLEDRAIRDAWERHISANQDAPIMRCLVTGELAPVARLHPSIKGVYGAQSSGASLVSFNARAFESYGHDNEQGLNAPVSERAAQKYATALNYLLAEPSHHVRLGDTTVVYWSNHKDDANTRLFARAMGNSFWLDDDDEAEDTDSVIDAAMKALARGTLNDIEDVDLDATFYVLGLAPSAARLVVKFFFKDSFGSMLKNLKKHYERSAIVHAPHEREYLTPYQLLREIEPPNAKKPVMTPILNGPLLMSMLRDTPYPQALYANVLQRIHATKEDPDNYQRKVTRARASIIRAYLIRNCTKDGYDERGLTVGLNEDRTSIGYCLGRAFAILEQIQDEANGKVTITNRYLNAASTTPSAVFPKLLKLAEAHLVKIQRSQPGYAIFLKKLLYSTVGEDVLKTFPKRLTLEEEGDFMLGYIHQKGRRYAGKATISNESAVNEEE